MQSNSPVPNNQYGIANGTNSNAGFITVFMTRDPNSNDFNYQVKTRWINTPSKKEWILLGFNSNSGVTTANWLQLGDGDAVVDFGVPNGTSPIAPDANGLVNFTSNDGSVTITGSAGGLNAQNIDFSATNATSQLTIQTTTPTPSSATAVADVINLQGNSLAVGNAGFPIQISCSGNTVNLNAQIGATIASPDATKCGVSSFNSTQFSTTSQGWVSLLTAFTQVKVTSFTTPGANTYTPTTGAKYCLVEVIGAGGGGGGAADSTGTPDTQTCGGGGGSGAYGRGYFVPSVQTVTIGSGGTAGSSSGGNGGTGGTSSFGSLISCTGGSGGTGLVTPSGANSQLGGTGGSASGSGLVFGSTGNPGGVGSSLNTTIATVFTNVSGFGANSIYGNGGASVNATGVSTTAGNNGSNGGGGSGAVSQAAGGSAGGVGGNGIVIVTEFLSV